MTCMLSPLSTCIPSSTQSTKSPIAPPCRDWFIARVIQSVPFLFFLCVANVPSCGSAYLICSAFSRLMLLCQCVESKLSTTHDKNVRLSWREQLLMHFVNKIVPWGTFLNYFAFHFYIYDFLILEDWEFSKERSLHVSE